MFPGFPPATRAILGANVLMFLLLSPSHGASIWFYRLALEPLGPQFAPWQLVTYAFLHESFEHIFFNMFALWMFGSALELLWGSRRFLVFYFVCIIAAACTQLWATSAAGDGGATVGASGGVFGLLLAFALYFPRQRILLFAIVPMPAWLFVSLYGIIELFLGVTNRQPGVAHFAHLGGMLGGALLILYWRSRGEPRLHR